MFKKPSFMQFIMIVTLFTFMFQTELQSADSQPFIKNTLHNNTQFKITYASKDLEKKFLKENLERMFTTALTKKQFYSKNGHYLLNVKVEELSSSSTSSSTEAISSLSYNLIDTDTNTSQSTAILSIPHREKNYSKLPQKEIETFTLEKSLQKNIDKFISLYLKIDNSKNYPKTVTAAKEQYNIKLEDEFTTDYFIGIYISRSSLSSNTFSNRSYDTVPNFKAGVIINNIHRMSLNYEKYAGDLSSYTFAYDFIFPLEESWRPYLGLHGGRAIIDFSNPNESYDEWLYGLQAGVIIEMIEHISIEFGVSGSQFKVDSSVTYRELKGFAGINYRF